VEAAMTSPESAVGQTSILARSLTPAQSRIVAAIYVYDLLEYDAIAAAVGSSPRTVKMHIEQIGTLIPGRGNPLLRVALYAERLLTLSPKT
jgi:hypothetical protein